MNGADVVVVPVDPGKDRGLEMDGGAVLLSVIVGRNGLLAVDVMPAGSAGRSRKQRRARSQSVPAG
jgi:hypothetical protein